MENLIYNLSNIWRISGLDSTFILTLEFTIEEGSAFKFLYFLTFKFGIKVFLTKDQN